MSNTKKQSQSVKDAIGALKYRLNQILPLYLGSALKNLSSIYQLPSDQDYARYSQAKAKYAMIAQLIHMLETSPAPDHMLANIPTL